MIEQIGIPTLLWLCFAVPCFAAIGAWVGVQIAFRAFGPLNIGITHTGTTHVKIDK